MYPNPKELELKNSKKEHVGDVVASAKIKA